MSCNFAPVWRRLQRSGLDWRRFEQGVGSKLLNYQITHLPNPIHKTVEDGRSLELRFSKNYGGKFTLGRFRSIAIFFAHYNRERGHGLDKKRPSGAIEGGR
jgi:hypothetical protein